MSEESEEVKDEEAEVEAAPAEPAVEEAKKREKPKAEKRKREEKGAFSYYQIEGEKVSRLRPFCERCGPGYFMANHSNRYTCGHCGLTKYKQDQ